MYKSISFFLVFLFFTFDVNLSVRLICNYKSISERTVIVHLFEWKWNDIANECEKFLGPNGFLGVQISPPNEHALIDEPFRPWWQRYQPVSYKLVSRSGSEEEFIIMIKRCKASGVRIYADVILNHMSASYGIGSAGSFFNAQNLSFNSVPYNSDHFNDKICTSESGNIDDDSWNDPYQVRNCRLKSLPDLATSNSYVREKLIEYLDFLFGIGVAGLRIDAAKHIWPEDLLNITQKFSKETLSTDLPFIYQEVYDDGTGAVRYNEYTHIGHVTEFRYGYSLSDVIRKKYDLKMKYLINFGTGWNLMSSENAIVFIDNHDTQRSFDVLNFHEKRNYKIANAFMLAWPYGSVKLMSSFNFSRDDRDAGPPSDAHGNTLNVKINKDGSCGNGWICEHRWREIANMVVFRNLVNNEPVSNWWDNDGDQIAFSRGNKGFITINNEIKDDMNVILQTGLKPGIYCDIISGYKINDSCTNKFIIVNNDGTAKISILNSDENPVIAIHIESKL